MTNMIKVIALAKDTSQFDQTWGKLFRETNQEYNLFENLEDLNASKTLDCDIFIVDNILKENIKGCTLIENLRKIKKLSFSSVVILLSYAPSELYLFKNIDLRPDLVMPLPFKSNNAKEYLAMSLNILKITSGARKAYETNDLNKVIKEVESLGKNDFSLELMAESFCKLSSFSKVEAKLFEQLKSNMWPSYILSREYAKEQQLSKFSFLIDETKKHHGLNIGVSYLYLQGNVMFQNAESDEDNRFLSKSNDYFNAPEFLHLISKYEFKRNKFRSALKSQLEYIKDKANTSLEKRSDYTLLAEYTDKYLSSEERKDAPLISEAIDCFNNAKTRNILDESLFVSALNFNIRLNMLKKDYSNVTLLVSQLIKNHEKMLTSHPRILTDIIYTISNSIEMHEIKVKLLDNTKIRRIIDESSVKISEKLKLLLLDANEKIKNGDYSEAEMILSKVLKNDPGNIDASFMMAETKLFFASLSSNYTRNNFVKMAMQVLEDANFPRSEWQKEKRSELVKKAYELA